MHYFRNYYVAAFKIVVRIDFHLNLIAIYLVIKLEKFEKCKKAKKKLQNV